MGDTSQSQPLQSSPLFKDLTQGYISKSTDTDQDGDITPLIKAANPCLRDGKTLPPFWKKQFKPETMACKPLEDIDPAYGNETFVVLGKGGTIHRISTSNSLFLLHPLNPLRKAATKLTSHYIFSAFMVAVVLLNVYRLNLDNHYWFDYGCTLIYILEFTLKVMSRGLVWGPFTCLRNPLNWLDLLTILTSVIRPITNVLESLQWFRLLKIVPLIKVMREGFFNIVMSISKLFGALLFGFMSMSFISTIGLQVYMGVLTQKCIKDADYDFVSDEDWNEYNKNSSNWIPDLLCGNATGAGICPNTSTCLQGFGQNPDFGYTNFHTFLWSSIQAYRIVSQDYLEKIYEQIIATSGGAHIFYYPLAYFLGTFLTGAFSYGVLGQYFQSVYNERARNYANKETDAQTVPRSENNVQPSGGNPSLKDALENISNHFGFEIFITLVIIFDIQCFFWNMSYYDEYTTLTSYNSLIVLVLYFMEFVIKVIGYGPQKYFKNGWNVFDVTVVVLVAVTQVAFGIITDSLAFLFLIRLFKIVPRWEGLNNMFKITAQTLKQFCGIFGLSFTFLILFALVGMELFGPSYIENDHYFPDGHIPRWNFVDFTHSFLQVFRSWSKETVESLWDCMLVSGTGCVFYFASVQFVGLLLTMVITIGIVLLTMTSLDKMELDNSRNKSTFTRLWELSFSKIMELANVKLGPKNKIDEVEVLRRQTSTDTTAESDEVESEEKSKPVKTSASKSGEYLIKLRNGVNSRPVLILSIAIIGISSLFLCFEFDHRSKDEVVDMSLIFYADIIFTVFFLSLTILKLGCFGIYFCLTNLNWIVDLIIVLESVVHMSLNLYDAVGFTYASLIFIRSMRPIMLVFRFERLKVVLLGILEELKTLFTYFASCAYVWFFFAVIMNAIYRRAFAWCVEPSPDSSRQFSEDFLLSDKLKYSNFSKNDCEKHNFSWQTAPLNFDDGPQSILTVFFMVIRIGWILILNDVFDSTKTDDDEPRMELDASLTNSLPMIVLFYVFGILITISILVGVVADKLKKSQNLFFTKENYKAYFELKNSKSVESSSNQRPEGCRGKFFDLVTSNVFNLVTIIIMIATFVILSSESYNMSYAQEQITQILYAIVVVLLFVEVTLKLIGLGKHFFSSAWNWFDLFTLLLLVLGMMMSDLIEKYFISPTILLIFRLIRVFRLLSLTKLQSHKIFFKTLMLVKPILLNIFVFQMILFYSYAVFGVAVFGPVKFSQSRFLNFQSCTFSFRTMFMLSTFSGVDGIYLMLANENECISTISSDQENCGHWITATCFVLSYLFLSFILSLNFYLVLILELISQINLSEAEACTEKFGDVELETVKDVEDSNMQTVAAKEIV